jgi:hypothetical protein
MKVRIKDKVANKGRKGLSWSNWHGGFEAVFPHIFGLVVVLWLALWLFHLNLSGDHVLGFGNDTPLIVTTHNTSWGHLY